MVNKSERWLVEKLKSKKRNNNHSEEVANSIVISNCINYIGKGDVADIIYSIQLCKKYEVSELWLAAWNVCIIK